MSAPNFRDSGTLLRRRSWGEHPLSFLANLSWALWALLILVLLPIQDLPAVACIWPGVWLAVNGVLTVAILKTLDVPVETAPRRDASGLVRGTSLFRDAMRRLRKNQLATLSAGLLVIFVVLCFGQGLLYWALEPTELGEDPESFFSLHLDPYRQSKSDSFQPPSTRHWFGTDILGRDIFSRTLFGGRVSFLVGALATLISLIVGVSWGAIAGYFGGRCDHYMMRSVDILYGLPFMFLVILFLTLVNGLHSTAAQHREAVETVQGLENAEKFSEAARLAEESGLTAEIRTAVFIADHFNPLYAIVLALGLVSWLTMARITRGQVLTLREREFVVAARTTGAGSLRIIFLHIVPNLLGPVIIYTTLTIPTIILAEAFLSFLGLGISEPKCSWGSLASDGLKGVNVIKPYWWLLTYPSAAISLALFSLNFIGDGLRDALDPKMKR